MSENLSKHTLGLTQLQSGQGSPSHVALKGSLYIDVLTSEYYKNTDGNVGWLPLVVSATTGFDAYVTGFTYDNQNKLTLSQNNGEQDINVYLNQFSGLTINGIISATTYYGDGSNLTGLVTNDFYVTGGTYSNGTLTLERQNGSVVVTGITNNNGGGGGSSGSLFYFNLSVPQSPYREISETPVTAIEQTSGVTIGAGLTSTIASFLTPSGSPNITNIPAGIWSFFLHSYKQNNNASFNIFCEVYVRTTGGTETLLISSDPEPITSNSPNPSMQVSDVFYSGTSLNSSDRILVKVRATNTSNQSHNVTFVTEGTRHYSYLKTSFGGLSTITLQQAYNNSTSPEITTNVTLGGVQFRGGTSNDTDNNIVIEDNSSNITGYWQADGTLFARTITGNSATIGVNLTVSGNTNTSSLTTHFATINNNLNVVGTTNVNTLSASSLTLYLQPNSGITNTEVLTRNSTTGNIEYQNISNFTYLTGGTYYEGDTIFRNNLNNTFTVLGTTTYSAGVLTGSTTWSPVLPLNGQINLPQLKVALYSNPNNIEPIRVYTISSGITGVDVDSLVNNQTNYIVIDYNGGSPIYRVLNNDGTVNDSSVILYLIVYRLNNFTHVLEFGNYGAGLPNKLNDRLIMTDRFGWESGLTLGLSGSTGIVTLSSGIAWNGSYRQNLISVNSQDDIFFKNYHSGGTWVYDTSGNTINNVYYDNGVNIVSGTTGKYLVNWYFRGQEINDHLYEVYGTSEYDDITIAEATGVPELPELITSHAFLVGRVIVGVNQTTGITQTAFSTVFQPSGAPGLHNNLTEIQGGTSGQYYHLNSNQYNNIALTNVDNNFSTSQRVNGNLSANTVTIVDLPTTNNNTTQLLTRNSTTGVVELTDSSSPNIFNYGLVFAISSGNYLQ